MTDSSRGANRPPEGEPEPTRTERPATEGAASASAARLSTTNESMVVASTDPIAREWISGLPGVEFSPISAEAIREGKLSTGWSTAHWWLPHMKTEFPPARTGRPMARRAGEKLRRAADSFSKDTRPTWAACERFVIDHPAQSLAAALAGGFFFARLMRRR